MESTIHYALRHKPTGELMPAATAGHAACWIEPENFSKRPPRLFARTKDARNALNAWLVPRGDAAAGEGRTRSDWEIVRVVVSVDMGLGAPVPC